MRNRHHIVFGQSVLNHNQAIKDRRLDMKYSIGKVIQQDGTDKQYYFSRVESIGDLIASRVSMLKSEDAWVDLDIGDPEVLGFTVPLGSIFVSVLVRYFNITKTRTPTLTAGLLLLFVLQYDNGGSEYKISIQMRNSNDPDSTKYMTLIGRLSQYKNQKGKLDVYDEALNDSRQHQPRHTQRAFCNGTQHAAVRASSFFGSGTSAS
jgi:hypothetical protein